MRLLNEVLWAARTAGDRALIPRALGFCNCNRSSGPWRSHDENSTGRRSAIIIRFISPRKQGGPPGRIIHIGTPRGLLTEMTVVRGKHTMLIERLVRTTGAAQRSGRV